MDGDRVAASLRADALAPARCLASLLKFYVILCARAGVRRFARGARAVLSGSVTFNFLAIHCATASHATFSLAPLLLDVQ
jgi:hypothetical protein